MPVLARRQFRRMRGGAQAHLMEGDDGHFYVVKFTDNPQHRRVLVNEWVASMLLDYLDIAHPEVRVIEISAEFLAANPDVSIQMGSSRRAVTPGWHFGSRFPGNPITQAVYDILPDALIKKIVNPDDFLAVLAFDKWAGNSDSRQAIFFRARIGEWVPGAANPLQVGFVAQMMDHGFLFDGPNWAFHDSPLFGLFFRPQVYARVRGVGDFAPWLERIESVPAELMDRILRQTPETWLPGDDRDALEKLLEGLMRRRKRVPDLVAECTTGRANPFPAWT
ncbi:MAG: hypothetical protein FJW32_28630 [Acidobacteria bacterium]|nr:hypothetical protein [Acidobacteriota bacterium]